jgi:hypothetical protein
MKKIILIVGLLINISFAQTLNDSIQKIFTDRTFIEDHRIFDLINQLSYAEFINMIDDGELHSELLITTFINGDLVLIIPTYESISIEDRNYTRGLCSYFNNIIKHINLNSYPGSTLYTSEVHFKESVYYDVYIDAISLVDCTECIVCIEIGYYILYIKY